MKVVQSHRKSNSNNIIVSTLPLYRSAPPLEVRHEDFELFAMDCLRGISDGLRRGKKSEEIKKLRALMSEFKLPYKAASNAEFESVKDKLGRVACSMGQTLAAVDAIFYKVPLCLIFCISTKKQWLLTSGYQIAFRKRYSGCNIAVAPPCETAIHGFCGGSRIHTDCSRLRPQFNRKRMIAPITGRNHCYSIVGHNLCSAIMISTFTRRVVSIMAIVVILVGNSYFGAQGKWTSTIREQEKDRLTPIVEALCTSYLGPDYSQSNEVGEISLKDNDHIAKTSFPFCMRHLFEKVREDHHLKHGGKTQLGLFLKVVLLLHDLSSL
ncbi:hypothetical protein F3Y22_tig00011547pilonHSYRG00012 [Hibiscus syriacus]|uniref:DNA primase large subunit C-terminal domain-containing protein n=1 Tax=Hibiscus syriacus TaxID=106335 RepID=A0A6A3C4H9_HIBSY|nr:hypothetical protein F3Y22_tig00011547pilonHSYRG00012 [Hibiscus syriacus]